jgi:hypothetical protein
MMNDELEKQVLFHSSLVLKAVKFRPKTSPPSRCVVLPHRETASAHTRNGKAGMRAAAMKDERKDERFLLHPSSLPPSSLILR